MHSRMAECRRRGLTGFRLDGCSVRRVANGKANGNGQLPHKHCWGSYPSEFRGEMGDGLRPILEARRRCLSANAKQRGAHAVVFRDDASGATLPAPTRWRGPPDNGLYHIKLELGPARTRRHAVAGLGPASLSFTKCCCVTRRSQDKYSVSTQHRRPSSPPSRRKTAAPGPWQHHQSRAGPSMRRGCRKHAVCRQDSCALRMQSSAVHPDDPTAADNDSAPV